MKILVTGGGGFLGRYIVEKLIARGDDVTSLSRSDHPELRTAEARTAIADIADKDTVLSALKGMDAVFHIASRVGIWGAKDEFYKTNVTGTKNIISACVKNGVGRLIYTSSPSVVFDGEDHRGIDETYPYPSRYLAFYPETKAIAEREVIRANADGKLLTCSLRPHLVWGPRDTNLIPRLITKAKTGRLRIVGDGSNMIDTVYVENAVDAHILALDKLAAPGSPVAGSTYFISQGEPVNCWSWINDVLNRFGLPPVTRKVSFKTAYVAGSVMELAYKGLKIRSEPPMTRFLALQLAKSHYFNIDKARKELGYKPAISMKEGMERLGDGREFAI
ncbi:NAD(P)H steroid dehydrogenase-like protein in alkane synthesis cluster [hydrothermal vent metagenome]|uniref:NAD(P)H steroid dehydrogenase-like protein in alkane synthesis cluster n=1 Tax=hydrothermal vent metagenome TaxID=652676 RepID=A0A3B1CRH3_9ZZZZ